MDRPDADRGVVRLGIARTDRHDRRQSSGPAAIRGRPDLAPRELEMYDPGLSLRQALLSETLAETPLAEGHGIERDLFLGWAMSLDLAVDPALAASFLTRWYADALRHWPRLDGYLREAAAFPRARLRRLTRRRRQTRRATV